MVSTGASTSGARSSGTISRLRRSSIRLQISAKLAVAFDPMLRQIDHRRFAIVTNRRQVVAARVAAPTIIPVLRHAEDVVEMSLTHHAERVEHFVFQRLDHSLDEATGYLVCSCQIFAESHRRAPRCIRSGPRDAHRRTLPRPAEKSSVSRAVEESDATVAHSGGQYASVKMKSNTRGRRRFVHESLKGLAIGNSHQVK